MFGKKPSKHNARRRFLAVEPLENRSLLAALAGSAWQNPLACNDLDSDGTVSPADALTAINAINAGFSGRLENHFAPPTLDGAVAAYFDADGDGELSPSDPLMVINALNSGKGADNSSAAVPAEDEHPETIGDDVPALELTDGFARVRAALNASGDVDVYRVDSTATQLHVSIFEKISGDVTVSVVNADDEELGFASRADATRHEPASVTITTAADTTYFVIVSGAEDATGVYCLQVLNNDPATEETDDEASDEMSETSAETTDTSEDTTDKESTDEHPRPPTAAGVFAGLDADADGVLSAEEFTAFPLPSNAEVTSAELFTMLDVDVSGGLTLEEFLEIPAVPVDRIGHHGPGGRGPGGHGPGGHGPRGNHQPLTAEAIFERLDADANGALSVEELSLPHHIELAVDEVFAAWDTDADGSLTLSEFQTGLESLKPATRVPQMSAARGFRR